MAQSIEQRVTGLPADYPEFLAEVKTRIAAARTRAALAVNSQLIKLYWEIGHEILDRERREGWGAKVIDRLAADLRREFPEMTGLSRANLHHMRRFADAWPGENADAIVQQPVRQLPWGQNIALLTKLKDRDTRLWYAAKAIQHGWSRKVLEAQIATDLRGRQGNALTSFERSLPVPNSELVRDAIKDPYNFEFLGLSERAKERDLELALLNDIQSFLMEMGRGFALVGRQFPLKILDEETGEDQEFFIDLLFYNYILRRFVVIDLKIEDFKPEFAGKMSFYLTAVDELERQPRDEPSIGLVLCPGRSKTVAQSRDRARIKIMVLMSLVRDTPCAPPQPHDPPTRPPHVDVPDRPRHLPVHRRATRRPRRPLAPPDPGSASAPTPRPTRRLASGQASSPRHALRRGKDAPPPRASVPANSRADAHQKTRPLPSHRSDPPPTLRAFPRQVRLARMRLPRRALGHATRPIPRNGAACGHASSVGEVTQ